MLVGVVTVVFLIIALYALCRYGKFLSSRKNPIKTHLLFGILFYLIVIGLVIGITFYI